MRRAIYCLTGLLLFQVAAGPNLSAQSSTQHCPAITVTCPDTIEGDTERTFKANVSGADAGLKLSYKWTVSGETTIVSGQGTPSLVIKARGGITTTVKVEVGGLASGCSNTASCSVTSCVLDVARLFDTYTKLPFDEEAARLKNFAYALKKEPGAQGYIIVYAAPKENAGAAHSSAGLLKNHLIKEYDIDERRLVTVDGGHRESMAVELYIVPTGITPPTPAPTLPPEGS